MNLREMRKFLLIFLYLTVQTWVLIAKDLHFLQFLLLIFCPLDPDPLIQNVAEADLKH